MKLQPVEIPVRPRDLRVEALAVADPRFTADTNSGLIELFDVIDDQTPARISAALRAIGNRPALVAINSPGGNVYAGLTAFNLLRGHAPGVTTRVLGIAASAAAVLAMAGERIEMARASQLMVHRAQGLAAGNAEIMDQVAAALRKVDGVMTEIFVARTQLPRAQVTAMLAEETFLDASEAVDLGFADRLLSQDALPAPKTTASATPASSRELEHQLRRIGFSRSRAARMATAAWPAAGGAGDENDLDLAAIGAAIAAHTAELSTFC